MIKLGVLGSTKGTDLEKIIETKISSISTSPERNDTILVEDPFKN